MVPNCERPIRIAKLFVWLEDELFLIAPGRVTFPKGKARLPTIYFQGLCYTVLKSPSIPQPQLYPTEISLTVDT